MSDRPANPEPPSSSPAPSPSPGDSGERAPASLFAAALHFFRARGELLGLEAKEATQIVSRRLLLLIGALAAFLIFYLLLISAVTVVINRLLIQSFAEPLGPWTLPLSIGIMAFLHLGAALILGSLARNKSTPSLFEFTRSEWQKDRAWLQKKTSRNGNKS